MRQRSEIMRSSGANKMNYRGANPFYEMNKKFNREDVQWRR